MHNSLVVSSALSAKPGKSYLQESDFEQLHVGKSLSRATNKEALKAAASINFPIHIEIKLCQFRSSGSLISVTILFEERRVIDTVPEKA